MGKFFLFILDHPTTAFAVAALNFWSAIRGYGWWWQLPVELVAGAVCVTTGIRKLLREKR